MNKDTALTRQSDSLHRTPPSVYIEDEEFVCIRWRKEPLKGSGGKCFLGYLRALYIKKQLLVTINAMLFSVIGCHEIKQVTSLR